MVKSDERIDLTMAQFDDALKTWRRKGAERAFSFAAIGSIPLALVGGFFFSGMAPTAVLLICAAYYCGLAALAIFTQ